MAEAVAGAHRIDRDERVDRGNQNRPRCVPRTVMRDDHDIAADVDPGNVSVQGLSGPGTLFMIHTFPPDHGSGEPFWHATDSIDYLTMI